ncbi:hypothetical protein VTN49DRAFT_4652 [Thermomyces lanuginosus]|uniref:uncharacterized protein n=1 Tax=Thermomyces lanuginosus TaxID=5541 RepID=UPI0037435F7C
MTPVTGMTNLRNIIPRRGWLLHTSTIARQPVRPLHARRTSPQENRVRISVTPAPKNIAESRLILSTLQKFGDVSGFWLLRNTQNEPSGSGQSDETKPAQTEGQCIAILDSPETATRLLEASPLRVQIPLSREQSDDSEEATNDMTCYTTPSSSPSSSSSSESIEEITGVENPYSAPFTIDTSDARVKDMMASGAPGNHIADCFTMHRRSKHGVDPEERRKRVKQAQKWSERMGAASLMGLWSSRDELHGTRRENP